MKTVRDLILELSKYDQNLYVAFEDPQEEIALPVGNILYGHAFLNDYGDEEILETFEARAATHIILGM